MCDGETMLCKLCERMHRADGKTVIENKMPRLKPDNLKHTN